METVQLGNYSFTLLTVIGGLLLIASLPPLALGIGFRVRYRGMLRRQTATAAGTYVGGTPLFMRFAYTVAGKPYEVRLSTRDHGGLLSFKKGQAVQVCYNPAKPDDAALAGRTADSWRTVFIIYTALSALMITAAVVLFILSFALA